MKIQYRIQKEVRFEAAHVLEGLGPRHPCSKMHGHSYRAIITLTAFNLDEVGMVIDFDILEAIRKKLDHTVLNEVLPFNPTAENIARWAYETINQVILQLDAQEDVKVEKVRIHETDTSWAEAVVVGSE